MILPLSNSASESYTIVILNVTYQVIQRWNTLGFWTLDFLDEFGLPLIYGVRIVTQTNLLEQYPQMPFDLFSSRAEDPTRDNLINFELEIIEK